jgi:hypothetical protein
LFENATVSVGGDANIACSVKQFATLVLGIRAGELSPADAVTVIKADGGAAAAAAVAAE